LVVIRTKRMSLLNDNDQALFSSLGTRGRRGRSRNSASSIDGFLATINQFRQSRAGI
jgi:hypothetical protein